jgi:hypothetical protein
MRQRLAAVLNLLLVACSSIGPGTVPHDRIDYGSSIGNSWKEQTLFNIVKLRYADMPIFLEVAQVIAGYQLQSAASGSFTLGNFTANLIDRLTATGGATAASTYTDHPKDGGESSVLIFGPSKDTVLAAKGREIKGILGLKPDLRELKVTYGGYSGRDDEIDMMTRSMLQIMLEFAATVQVPESDVAQGKATPGMIETQAAALNSPPLRVLVTVSAPARRLRCYPV